MPADTRGQDVVFDLLDGKKEQDDPHHRRKWQEQRHEDRGHGRQDRPEHRHQLEQAGQDSQHDGVR
jgi:hypothetical protein